MLPIQNSEPQTLFLTSSICECAHILKIPFIEGTNIICHLFSPKRHPQQSQNYNTNTTTNNVFGKHVMTFFYQFFRNILLDVNSQITKLISG